MRDAIIDRDEEEIVGEVRKSKSEVFRVSVGDWGDRSFCYVTVWEREAEGYGPGRPTKKGLTLSPRVMRDLLPLLEVGKKIAADRERRR